MRPVPTLWAEVEAQEVPSARYALRVRENANLRDIGYCGAGVAGQGLHLNVVRAWAQSCGIDGVVWTCLGPKWRNTEGRIPTADEVLTFLRAQPKNSEAEEYIRKAPKQVDTMYRRRIVADLGWTHIPA